VARRVERSPLTCIISPYTTTSLIVQYLEGNRGGSPVMSLYFLCAFRGLQHALGGYISLHLLVLLRFEPLISSHSCLYLSFFSFLSFSLLFRWLQSSDWPHTLPHILFVLFCSTTPLRPVIPPLHAYHSLLVWPLYQQPLSLALTPCAPRQAAPIAMYTHKVELKDAQYIYSNDL